MSSQAIQRDWSRTVLGGLLGDNKIIDWARGIGFVLLALMAGFSLAPGRIWPTTGWDMTTTHPIYLPRNYEMVEGINPLTSTQTGVRVDPYVLMQVERDFETYQARAEESQIHLLVISQPGEAITIDYFAKNPTETHAYHTRARIEPPRYGFGSFRAQRVEDWQIKDGKLVVDRRFGFSPWTGLGLALLFISISGIAGLGMLYYYLIRPPLIWLSCKVLNKPFVRERYY